MGLRNWVGVPDDAAMVEVLGVRLAVAREGEGPAVVCLHAIGHGGGDFAALSALLRDRFEVIRVDWPGQGRSGAEAQPASAARYAELLEALLDRLGIAAPILLGCSIGGAAALHYAARQPVRALVLCDPGGLIEVTPAVQRFCRLFAHFFAAGERGAWWFPLAFRAYYRLVLPAPAAREQRRRITAAAFESASVLRQAWTGFAAPAADVRALAAGLDVPVWFAWARRDRIVRFVLAKPTIDRMRRASVTLFDGGHAAFLEQPEVFARAFADFAAALPLPATATVAPLSARRA